MGIRDWLINKLEENVENTNGHIELEELSEEERDKLFEEFGEGNSDLTNFLQTAFNHDAPSIFCCSGHGVKSPYVVLKVNEENIELLRKLGRVLSNEGIVTNFVDDYMRGTYVDYRAKSGDPSTTWLKTASEIMEHPELYDDSNPSIYYHETMTKSYKPFLFDFKKKLLDRLRKKKTATLSSGDEHKKEEEPKKNSWELTDDERKAANDRSNEGVNMDNIIKFNLDELKNNPDGFSKYILGRSYDLEENGATQDFKKALEYYEEGNKLGYPLCTYSLGISYVFGLGDELIIDKEKGNKLLEEAYPKIEELINSQDTNEIEKVYAKFVTGAYYYFGLGGKEKDYNKAFEIIKECADSGHIAAIYDLGATFYYKGKGTTQDLNLSEHYLGIAKRAGLKRAIKKYDFYGYKDRGESNDRN